MALEKEKNRLVLEKCQNILKELLKDEDNKYCVDCDAKSPRWASWNIGIFLCIRCAGIHRNLGVHISKVKSVNLDTWTPQQVACIQQMGNSRARAVYEANLQDNFRRPQTNSSLEQFIRAKYEAKKYIAREWIPPPMPNPSWEIEIENQLKKRREKKLSSGTVEFPVPVKSSSISISPKPLPKAPGRKNSSPNQSKRTSISGSALSTNSNQHNLNSGKTKNNSSIIDLLMLDSETPAKIDNEADIFGDFLTAPSPSVSVEGSSDQSNSSNQNEESNFFDQKIPESAVGTAATEKLSKDSILALYSQTPTHQGAPPPLFGGGGGGAMFLAGPVIPGGAPVIPQSAVIPNPHQNMLLCQQQQKGPYFSHSIPGMGSQMHVGMMGGVPPSSLTTTAASGIQLSAANPFAQMHSQMNNLSLGSVPQPAQMQQSNPSMIMGNFMVPNTGMASTSSQQPNTLSANHWQ